MTINASIEARMTSSRLPGKVMMPIGDKPALECMIERVRKAKKIDNVIVATTTNKEDDPIVTLCKKLKVPYYRGSENNVFQRVLQTHVEFKSDVIVELTGDCPIIDPILIDEAIECYQSNSYDYVSNCIDFTYPLGMAVEVFSLSKLQEISKTILSEEDKEHVSVRFFEDKVYSSFNIEAEENLHFPELSVTLDTQADYEMITTVYNNFAHNNFTLEDIISFIKINPHLLKINPIQHGIY